jgi:two-component system, cell cycle sensor histidine kinase and response regulator CckA
MLSSLPGGATAFLASAQALPFGIATTDPYGKVTFANAAYAELAGCTPDELLGQSAGDFPWDELAVAMLSSEPWRGQAVCKRKTGETYSVEHSITALCDPAGEVTGFWIIKRDATDLKRPTGTPYQAEANLSALIESTDDLIASFDLEYRLVAFNTALADTIKRTVGVNAVVGMRLEEWLPAQKLALWPPMFDRALSEGPFRDEYSLVDGRTLELSFNPIRQHGQTTGISVFGKDITDRKAADRTLREAESKYRGIFNGALEGMYRTTLRGRCLAVNPVLAKMLGYDSAKEAKLAITDTAQQVWINPQERSLCLQVLEQHGSVRGYECQIKRKDGTLIWVSLNIRRVGSANEEAAYYEGFVEDITERRRAEAALKQANEAIAKAERHYRRMFNGVSDAVFVSVLREDGSPGRFIEVNDQACRCLGYTRDELLQLGPHDITAPEVISDIATIREGLLTKGHALFETINVAKDGRRIPTEVNAHTYNIEGTLLLLSSVRSIEDRKDAEKQYRDIFDGAVEGMFRTSIEKRQYVAANPALASMLGYDSAQDLVIAIKDTAHQLWLDPDERARCAAILEEHGHVRDRICQFKRKDGAGIWVSINAHFVNGQDGRPLYCDGFVQDITERKRMEETLRRSEEKFSKLFLCSPAVTILFTPATKGNLIADVNEAFEQNSGFRREEVIGRTTKELGLWADPSDYDEFMNRFQTAGRLRTFEHRVRKKNGDIGVGLTSAELVELDEQPYAISATIDITEKKEAERALQRANETVATAERHYRLMFNSVSDALLVHTFGEDGLPSHFLEVNDNACRLLGYTRDELVQMGLFDLDPPEDHPNARTRAERIFAERDLMWEGTFVRKDGRRIPVEVNTHLVDLGGSQTIISSVRDITDRKEAEKKYRHVFDGALEGIFRTSLDGRPLLANPALATMLGYDSVAQYFSKMTDSTHQVWMDPNERSEYLKLFEKQDVIRGYECQLKRRDGNAVWVSLNSRKVCRVDGQVLYTEGFMEDITQRKRMQDALRKSEEKFAIAFQSNPAMTVLFRPDEEGNRAIDVNEAFEQATGYLREEVIGRTSQEIQLFADSSEHGKAMTELRLHGRVRNSKCHFRKKTGDIRTGLLSATSIELDGQPCAIATTIDITEQENAEQARTTLVTAVEQASETIVITDLTGTIQYCNPAFSKVTGYSKEEAIGQNPRVLKSGKHSKEFYEEMWATITQGSVWTGHLINKKKDGSFYEEEATISPIRDTSGKTSGFVGVKRDVTRRIRLEDQLRQAQKLESIGRLAGGVAHDFNNLLTVINGYSGFLLRALKPGDPLRSYAEEITTAGERAASLTKQLLAFSRKQVIEPKVLDLNAIIQESTGMLQRLIGDDIILETHLDSTLGQVMADPDQIHQVIMNLAVNARDAMPDGGALDIETVNVELTKEDDAADHPEHNPARYVVMTVTDTGHGMDEAIRQQVFEPFFTTKGVGKGTGLGLSTVYGIIRQNCGWIDVWSEVGVGTTFKMYLPRIDTRLVAERKGINAPSEGGSETILVVEDQKAVRAFAKASLRQHGYSVIEASDGDEALSVAKQHSGQIHLLLTDVVMPGLNGKELSVRLTELRPNLRVLFISGYTADVIAQRGVLDPGVAFLHKPFGQEELAQKVREVLDRAL